MPEQLVEKVSKVFGVDLPIVKTLQREIGSKITALARHDLKNFDPVAAVAVIFPEPVYDPETRASIGMFTGILTDMFARNAKGFHEKMK